jgi:cytochrome c-type biogenesis protein CcmH
MSSRRLVLLAAIPFLLLALRAAAIDITVLPTPELQARYEKLTHEFRCMQCQNNSIADSPVGLASDLRREVKEQLIAGKSDDEIRAFLVARYGDFVLYKPPVKGVTWLLWFGPFALLLLGGVVWLAVVRRRKAAPEPVAPPDAQAQAKARALIDGKTSG